MAVVSVTEIGRQGSWIWQKYQKQFQRSYRVVCNAFNDTESTILSALPYVPGNTVATGIYCVKSEVNQEGPSAEGSYFIWTGTVHFDSVIDFTGGNDPSTNSSNPILRLPVYSYDLRLSTLR
jgi:hypothetical protein